METNIILRKDSALQTAEVFCFVLMSRFSHYKPVGIEYLPEVIIIG